MVVCLGRAGRDLVRTLMDMKMEAALLVVSVGLGEEDGSEGVSDIISCTSTGCRYGSATNSSNLFFLTESVSESTSRQSIELERRLMSDS